MSFHLVIKNVQSMLAPSQSNNASWEDRAYCPRCAKFYDSSKVVSPKGQLICPVYGHGRLREKPHHRKRK